MAKSKGKVNVKVPKRIAGVKIPKPIRKGPVGDFLNSSGGQVLVAEALLIAGSALLAKRSDPDSRVGELLRHPLTQLKEAGRGTAATASHAGESIGDVRQRLAAAFSAALVAFRETLDQDDYSESRQVARRDDDVAETAIDELDGDHAQAKRDDEFGKKKRGPATSDVVGLSPPPPPPT